jgi:hypothetical protein
VRAPVDALRIGIDLGIEHVVGVSTRDAVSMDELGLYAGERVWYEPTAWAPLLFALRSLRVSAHDVLLEYGAGKGRVLTIARMFPFRRVIGLEASPELAAQAESNLKRARTPRRCRDVVVEVADAARWPVPRDVSVVYMYCPFTGNMFRRAIDILLESVDAAPRPVRLVYNNPYEHNFLLATGRFRPLAVIPAMSPAPLSWYSTRLLDGYATVPAWHERKVIVTYEVTRKGDDAPGTTPRTGWGRGRHIARPVRCSQRNSARFSTQTRRRRGVSERALDVANHAPDYVKHLPVGQHRARQRDGDAR